MEAERFIQLQEQPYPYGPHIVEGEAAARLKQSTDVTKRYSEPLSFVARQIGSAKVSELERVATALFVSLDTNVSPDTRIKRLVELKPHTHIPVAEAPAAFERLDQIRTAAIGAGLQLVPIPWAKPMTGMELLKQQFKGHVAFREHRPGGVQVLAPLFHEDGDMVDIFIDEPRSGSNRVRISDHGMTLMRLTYSYDLATENKRRIFNRILSENQVSKQDGRLYVDAEPERLYPAIL
jgi:hypothetical protein